MSKLGELLQDEVDLTLCSELPVGYKLAYNKGDGTLVSRAAGYPMKVGHITRVISKDGAHIRATFEGATLGANKYKASVYKVYILDASDSPAVLNLKKGRNIGVQMWITGERVYTAEEDSALQAAVQESAAPDNAWVDVTSGITLEVYYGLPIIRHDGWCLATITPGGFFSYGGIMGWEYKVSWLGSTIKVERRKQ